MTNQANSKPASKIRKGDRIIDGDKIYTVTKRGRGYGSDEVQITINEDEDLNPIFEKYITYPQDVDVAIAE